jgi:hypothetical protein
MNNPPTTLVGFGKEAALQGSCRLAMNDPPTALVGFRTNGRRLARWMICLKPMNLKRLLAGYRWKIVEKLIERETGFYLVDQGVDRNAGTAKHRCAADNVRIARDWKALYLSFFDYERHSV